MKKVFLLLTIPFAMSCTNSGMARLGGFGSDFKIELINCDGSIAKTYVSSGKVRSEKNSDGYYFLDKKNNVLVELTGNLIITQIK